MKKIISMFLAILMIVSATTLLFSCGGENDSGKSTNEVKQYEEDSIFYERSLVSDNLPEMDFGGRSLRVAAYSSGEFLVKEEDRNQGNLINDAIYARTTSVENRFNVKVDIVYKTGNYSELDSYVSKTVLAGTDEFDLVNGMVMSTAGLVLKKVFLNWYDIDYIDFSKPWWYSSNANELTYNGKNCIAISHLNYSAVSGAYCMYFNKNLAASYELGDLYELVLNGKWTFDKLAEMVKDIYTDDGNDERDLNDFYGFTQGAGTQMNAYLWAFDNPIVSPDADGVPQISVKTDKIDSIMQDIYDFCWNSEGVYYDPTLSNEKSVANTLFYSKKAIFMQGTVSNAAGQKLRDFEDEYGLLPMPKYTEEQQKYKTMVGGHHSCLAVPKTCKDTAFVGLIVEALAAESWKTVTPTLYEIALKTRYLRDSESKEILDMIIEGTTFDFGSVYDNWKGFAFMVSRMIDGRQSNFQSYYDKTFKQARLHYKQVVKALDKV